MMLPAPTPILRIFDEAKARAFYLDWLGFTVDFEHRFEPGTPIYMGISLGACKLHLSEHHGDGTPGAYVRIGVTDGLAAYQQALLAKQYKYYRPHLEDRAWNAREMPVDDGFGNKLIFWEPLG